MDAQAASFFSTLPASIEEILWIRPLPGEWSPGENLSHVAVVHRFFRRFHRLIWPFASGVGRLRGRRPIECDIDDVYARPDFPHAIGRIWPPDHSPTRLVPLAGLAAALRREHQNVRAFCEAREPELLGRAMFYVPAIGWINFVQSLRVAVFHDAHHFEEIRRAFSSAAPQKSAGA
jgi:hypothetical protein